MRNSLKFPDPFFMKFSTSISGTKKIARWVPRMLADDNRKKRMGAALKILERYHRDGDKFLDHIVTGDETWVSHFTPESKRRSIEWHHPRSPSKPMKFKQTLSNRKIMATVVWDRKGVLLVEFMT
jgi:histone-lysine N-methyltransferase SETMAR